MSSVSIKSYTRLAHLPLTQAYVVIFIFTAGMRIFLTIYTAHKDFGEKATN